MGLCVYSIYIDKGIGDRWTAFLQFFGAGTASGGFGLYLSRVDRQERENVRQQQYLDLLLERAKAHPGNTTLQRKLEDLLIAKATGQPAIVEAQ